jgi:LSD1 subclass zinc finger protein
MLRARCPSCQRLLNLPEDAVGREVRCPLCETVFPARPENPRQTPPRAAPEPEQPWRPPERPERPAAFEGPSRMVHETIGRRAGVSPPLQHLGNWLFALSLMSFLWNGTCGCGGLFSLGRLPILDQDLVVLFFFLLYLAPIIVYLIIMITSQTLHVRSGSRWAFLVGAWLATFELLFGGVRLILLLISVLDVHPEGGLPFLLNLISLLLSLSLFAIGVLCIRTLAREPARSRTDQERQREED